MLLSATNICPMSSSPSTHLSVSMYACQCESMYVCPTICFSVHHFICIYECLFQRVNVSVYPPVSPPVCVFKYVTLSACMFSFRSSVRPIVRTFTRLVVGRQFECNFLSLMHVCMSVIVLLLLTSNFDVYSRVCMRAYESILLMRACILTVCLSVYSPG